MEEKGWLKNYDPGVPHHIDIPSIAAHELLEQRTQKSPQALAVTVFGMQTTYDELNRRANAFAHALMDWGIGKGDRVALLLANSPAFIACQFGIWKAGAVAVPINPLYTGRELSRLLGDSGAQVAVVLSLFAGNLAAVMDQTHVENVLTVPIPAMEVPIPEGFELLDDFCQGRPDGDTGLAISPHDPALILYTGGTTGVPKGAVLTHISQVYSAFMLRSLDPTLKEHQDSFVLVNPLFHIMGNCIMTFCIHAGLPVHLVPRYDAGLVLETIQKARPTWFPGVPTMFIGVMNHPEVDKYDLTSIKFCISAAAPFPLEAMERFEAKTGCRVVEAYGLTESGTAVTFNPFVNQRRPGSIGFPTADIDARIVDVETGTRELPQGEAGELVLKGPPIMSGYWDRPDETADALRDGWLYTGDIAYMDEDGYFWIVDRKKDMIIAGGFNIYPGEIEEVLHEHPKVHLACAVGIPHPYRGETVKAFVVPIKGEELTPHEVIEFCRQHLAAYKVPTEVEFRESLPTSIVGKVLRRILREEELAKCSQPDDP